MQPVKKDRKKSAVGIVPAAGLGIRMGAGRPKQFLEVKGVPVLALTLRTLQECDAVDRIIVTAPKEALAHCREEIVGKFGLDKVAAVVPGGRRRQDSVRRGLDAAGKGFDLAVIHDGVRPLAGCGLVEAVLHAAEEYGAAVAGLQATETVKEADESGCVLKTLDRSRIWLIQTPQAFSFEIIRQAHDRAEREGWPEATDDAALVEQIGVPVKIVPGLQQNIKVTIPADLEVVRLFLEKNG